MRSDAEDVAWCHGHLVLEVGVPVGAREEQLALVADGNDQARYVAELAPVVEPSIGVGNAVSHGMRRCVIHAELLACPFCMTLRVRDPRADINTPPEGKRVRRVESLVG